MNPPIIDARKDFTFDNRAFLFAPPAFTKQRKRDINNIFNLNKLKEKYIKIYISTKYVHTERRGKIIEIKDIENDIVKVQYEKHDLVEDVCLREVDWTIDDPTLTSEKTNPNRGYNKRKTKLLAKMKRMGRLTMLLRQKTSPTSKQLTKRNTTIGLVNTTAAFKMKRGIGNSQIKEEEEVKEENRNEKSEEVYKLQPTEYDFETVDEEESNSDNEEITSASQDRRDRYSNSAPISYDAENNYVIMQMNTTNTTSSSSTTARAAVDDNNSLTTISKIEEQLINKIKTNTEKKKKEIAIGTKKDDKLKLIYLRPDDISQIEVNRNHRNVPLSKKKLKKKGIEEDPLYLKKKRQMLLMQKKKRKVQLEQMKEKNNEISARMKSELEAKKKKDKANLIWKQVGGLIKMVKMIQYKRFMRKWRQELSIIEKTHNRCQLLVHICAKILSKYIFNSKRKAMKQWKYYYNNRRNAINDLIPSRPNQPKSKQIRPKSASIKRNLKLAVQEYIIDDSNILSTTNKNLARRKEQHNNNNNNNNSGLHEMRIAPPISPIKSNMNNSNMSTRFQNLNLRSPRPIRKMYHHYNDMQKPLWGGISNARNANNDNSITKKKVKMKTKKKKRKKRKKKDLKGKKDFKKGMAKKEDYPETSIDPVSRQDLIGQPIAYSKNSSSSVELTHPVINLSDSIVDNNFQQDDIITVKVEKQLLTIENGKIKDDYEHDHRQNNTSFENEEKRKKKMRKSIKHKQATNKSIVDKKMKLYKKNQYKYVKKLANSGLRLVAWGTQADVIEDNGTMLYDEARDIYLKSL